jgi:hypothetical protein
MEEKDLMKTANKSIGKYTRGFGLSFVVASLVSALLVVLKETVEPLKAWMKTILGHHWITQGALVLALFIVLGVVLSNTNPGQTSKLNPQRMLTVIIVGAIISGIIIAGFYLTHI